MAHRSFPDEMALLPRTKAGTARRWLRMHREAKWLLISSARRVQMRYPPRS